MVRVKICGLTRKADVAAAIAAGADALGFVFTPRSPRYVEPDMAAELLRDVPAFVSRVGLFMDQDRNAVASIQRRLPLSLLQFHGGEDAQYCRGFGLPYVKAIGMGGEHDPDKACTSFHDAAGLLLDSHPSGSAGGTGIVFDWSRIPAVDRPLILAGGLTPDNVGQAVRQVRPWAVDVSSGVEDAPGIKNEARMRKFIEEAKREY